METFFGCLLIWFVVSIFYAIMCPRGIGSGKIGFVIDIILGAPAMIILISWIALLDVVQNIKERNRK